MVLSAAAHIAGWWATGLEEVTGDVSRLDTSGRWAVAIPYSGPPVCARFSTWSQESVGGAVGRWSGPSPSSWSSSLAATEYEVVVESIRSSIANGDVYQANICRVLSAVLPDTSRADVGALAALLESGNPAPYGGFLRLPDSGVHIASASPELFLSLDSRGVIRSGPIKGTGRQESDLTDKDAAENVMIVDLVRNDLSIISQTGTVSVPSLLEVQEHPGLVHLVSYVEGTVRDGTTWPEILAATFPPGSVTGAPKLAALDLIDQLESAERSFYCGAFGWVDADQGTAELAVAIRTFWIDGELVQFGTGAGITWGSDPAGEWRETELKAARLISVASRSWPE